MLPDPEFEPFEKIARLKRNITITEKIDGSNAQIYISEDGQILAGSRKRWVYPGKEDNFGFAGWVESNKSELIERLGPGRHYGEWWGAGIQRRYGQTEKHFSLFNVSRWFDKFNERGGFAGHEEPPECCLVVPVLYHGPYGDYHIENCLDALEEHGSVAAPNFMDPEGVVIYHAAGRVYFKVTIKNDEKPKGSNEVS